MSIIFPHLPSRPVTLCALSAGLPYIREALEQRGVAVLEIPAQPALPAPLSSHPDLVLHPLEGGGIVVARGGEELGSSLKERGFPVYYTGAPHGKRYPGDSILNCFLLQGWLFCNPKTVDRKLLNIYQSRGRGLAAVKQGYTKCSTCIVDTNSIITADRSIYKAAAAVGINSLLIRPGFIRLEGYAYGFIGGCTAQIAPDRLVAFGNLRLHPDWEHIKAFCKKRGVGIDVLCPERDLQDCGGLIGLLE